MSADKRGSRSTVKSSVMWFTPSNHGRLVVFLDIVVDDTPLVRSCQYSEYLGLIIDVGAESLIDSRTNLYPDTCNSQTSNSLTLNFAV